VIHSHPGGYEFVFVEVFSYLSDGAVDASEDVASCDHVRRVRRKFTIIIPETRQ